MCYHFAVDNIENISLQYIISNCGANLRYVNNMSNIMKQKIFSHYPIFLRDHVTDYLQ